MYYFKIKPITFGQLQEKKANAITWTVGSLIRGSSEATAYCGLIWVNPDGSTIQADTFTVTIDNATLQSWGADDSVIDDVILAHSPLFEKDNS